MYESSWLASTDPDIKRGVATFVVNGEQAILHLDEFEHFRGIDRMFRNAYANGERAAQQRADTAIKRALQELANVEFEGFGTG